VAAGAANVDDRLDVLEVGGLPGLDGEGKYERKSDDDGKLFVHGETPWLGVN
jgi:hypothetical protein